MTGPQTLTIAAIRLREGDRVPSVAADATVDRPPRCSPDGSMVTVVLAVPSAPDRYRFMRWPAHQHLTIERFARPSNTAFIRATKTAQSSGSRILILDLDHPDSEIAITDTSRFAVLCTSHHTIAFHAGVSDASAQASHPEEWCQACREATADRARSKVAATSPRGHRKASA